MQDANLARLAPSTYHDPREVVWKHLVAQAYWDIVDLLRDDEDAAVARYEPTRLAFVNVFNRQHDVDLLCRETETLATRLVADIEASEHGAFATRVAQRIAQARESLQRAMESLRDLRQVEPAASYVVDGTILIAGKPAETFADNPDFVAATLQLIGEEAPAAIDSARNAWRSGFVLDPPALALVNEAKRDRWSADDLLAGVLLCEQRSRRHPTLREFEFVPMRSAAENRSAKLQAIDAGYFLLGRLMACIALSSSRGTAIDPRASPDSCPLDTTLRQAGIALTASQLAAFRRFALVRCTHGLNPGEFTARIAASVRTSFPQALLASLAVRSGRLHGGALPECMKLLDAYLAARSRSAFVAERLASGELYGFGHRIHKPDAVAGDEKLRGDPRVALQLETVRQAFPRQQPTIDAFEQLALQVAASKPGLAPNTDFGAAIWFHCLGLDPEAGSGFFTMARLPGMIAQVINQLDVRANALRPPLAVNLPYTA